MTPREFELTCEGYRNKLKSTEALLRKHAIFILSGWGVKPSDAYNAWQLEGEISKTVNSSLVKRLMDYKAKKILESKDVIYRKVLQKWQKD